MSSVNLAHIFGGLANRWPNRTAVVSPHLKLSYHELLERASRSARELQSRGIERAARVGICHRDGAETIVLMLALWMAGATVVVLDFRTSGEERKQLVTEFDLAAILEDRPSPMAGYNFILVDSSWPDSLARHDRHPIWPKDDEPVPAIISLTSGTTGGPLGIVLGHDKQLLQAYSDLSQQFGALFLNPLPLWFGASRNHTLGALLKGSTVCFHPPLFSAEELVEAALVSKATSVSAVPTIIRGMFEVAAGQSKPMLEPLEALFCFGAPLFPEEKLKAKELLCANFRDQYGSGICGRISAIWGSDLEQRPDSVGRPLPLVLLQIVDDHDEVLPVGQPGVIRLRSPGVSSIIYGEKSRASGDSFKNGWAYPGDIGALDAEGFLRLLGRTSDRIIRGGINIQPAEVQAALAKCPGVEEVFVMGSAQGREDEEVVAFIVGDAVKEEDLVAHCRVWLSPDKRPRRFVFVSELPRTSKGEVSRSKLSQHLNTV